MRNFRTSGHQICTFYHLAEPILFYNHQDYRQLQCWHMACFLYKQQSAMPADRLLRYENQL